jgi:NADH:ubiquinone oxidoreductase subunit 6 (subunit J)
MTDPNPRVVYLPTHALLGLLGTITSWFLTAIMFFNRNGNPIAQKHPWKIQVVFVISVVLSIYMVSIGRRALAPRMPKPGQQIGLTPFQAVWVTVFVVFIGLLYAWVAN